MRLCSAAGARRHTTTVPIRCPPGRRIRPVTGRVAGESTRPAVRRAGGGWTTSARCSAPQSAPAVGAAWYPAVRAATRSTRCRSRTREACGGGGRHAERHLRPVRPGTPAGVRTGGRRAAVPDVGAGPDPRAAAADPHAGQHRRAVAEPGVTADDGVPAAGQAGEQAEVVGPRTAHGGEGRPRGRPSGGWRRS